MAASTGMVLGKFLQIQRPLSAVWRHGGSASVNCMVLRSQSNQSGSGGGAKETKTPAAKAPAPPPTTTDGKSYEVQEYFGHNEMSFYELESAMLKFRLTQPDPSKPEPAAAK
ncbi:uncharacterized protein [Amphiura filiformis]|uniref:uncharacterized protein isoform X2 n=1 Tax=Amphiura filiformis TaxID=82378 RepID=UPI003B22776F